MQELVCMQEMLELFQRYQSWYARGTWRRYRIILEMLDLVCPGSIQKLELFQRCQIFVMSEQHAGDLELCQRCQSVYAQGVRRRYQLFQNARIDTPDMQEIQNHSKDARVCTLKEYAGDISYSRTDMPQMLELICPRSCQSYSRDARVGMPKEHAGVRVILEMLELVCQKSMIYLICLRA